MFVGEQGGLSDVLCLSAPSDVHVVLTFLFAAFRPCIPIFIILCLSPLGIPMFSHD